LLVKPHAQVSARDALIKEHALQTERCSSRAVLLTAGCILLIVQHSNRVVQLLDMLRLQCAGVHTIWFGVVHWPVKLFPTVTTAEWMRTRWLIF
jgi:hypothetical protein